MCVCVWERERERERSGEGDCFVIKPFLIKKERKHLSLFSNNYLFENLHKNKFLVKSLMLPDIS